ncbi:hypothetical protein [Streptomyces sp. NPDC088254]|uniref:hypothetical protein n=1 Tax=Streptomyces sp. NPDC088254 TaxID=3365847 RepID=UPI003806E36D
MAKHQCLGLVPGSVRDAAARRSRAEPVAEEPAGAVGEEVTGHDSAGCGRDDQRQADVAGAGERPGGQKQGGGRDEGADQEDRLSEDRGGHHLVGSGRWEMGEDAGEGVHGPGGLLGAVGVDEGLLQVPDAGGGALAHTVRRPVP